MAKVINEEMPGQRVSGEVFPRREYFTLHHSSTHSGPYEESFRTLALSQLEEEDVYINPSNRIQDAFGTARHVPNFRSRLEAKRMIAHKSRAAAWAAARERDVLESELLAPLPQPK